ncbi:MAG: bacterioferritin [Pseudomonadota bacterium]
MTSNKNQAVIDHLNIILRNELMAINQYFLHAKILEDQGFMKLGAVAKAESIDEMRHADVIMARILFLKGMPKMNDYKKMYIGETVEQMLKSDFQLEVEAIADLKDAIAAAIENRDTGTKDLLEKILISEETHYAFLETQLELIQKVGLQNYLVTQI